MCAVALAQDVVNSLATAAARWLAHCGGEDLAGQGGGGAKVSSPPKRPIAERRALAGKDRWACLRILPKNSWGAGPGAGAWESKQTRNINIYNIKYSEIKH